MDPNDKSSKLNIEKVEKLIQREKLVEAFREVLQHSAPNKSKNQQEKDIVLLLVMKILVSVNGEDNIKEFVKKLDGDGEKDILMKYVYRGFERPAHGSSAKLLIWNEITLSATGLGTIVRVFTDRNKV